MGGFGSGGSVGSLLADIAHLVTAGLDILAAADARHWTQDEHELLRATERLLDDARGDFRELSGMLQGQSHYENDRTFTSIHELESLRAAFAAHLDNLDAWSRAGGPVNPVWIRDTTRLARALRRAQRRAAQRVADSNSCSDDDEASTRQRRRRRCLAARAVHRRQRAWHAAAAAAGSAVSDHDCRRRPRDEMLECCAVGGFERFGRFDWVFICDFCDGHLVWSDLEALPTTPAGVDDEDDGDGDGASADVTSPTTTRSSLLPTTTRTRTTRTTTTVDPWARPPPALASTTWLAFGRVASGTQRLRKRVVYPPLAIASHLAPCRGDWLARLLCPLCEEAAEAADEEGAEEVMDDDDDLPQEETRVFDDLAALQEHLEWHHSGRSSSGMAIADRCVVM